MELHIFFAVLLAAALHATWNAFVKGGKDPFLSLTHMSLAATVVMGIAVCFVSPPKAAAWPWICASILFHLGYRLALAAMYRIGDMGQVYSIARGTAPFLTALVTLLLAGERLGTFGYTGICLLGLGVTLISLKGSRLSGLDPKAVLAALTTSAWICGYTYADGQGARVNGDALSFIAWCFLMNALANLLWCTWQRSFMEIITTFRAAWLPATAAALSSEVAYAIAIWAMTKAPIAVVAALRETSVLFAAIISVVFLREPLTVWRLAAAPIIVAGAMLLRLG